MVATLNMNPHHQSLESQMPRRRSLRLLTTTPVIPIPPSLRKSPYLKSPIFSQGLSSPTLPSEEDEVWLQDTIPISKSRIVNPSMIATEGGSPLSARGNMDRRGSIVQRKGKPYDGRGQARTVNLLPPSISTNSLSIPYTDASGREFDTQHVSLSGTSPFVGNRRRWSAIPTSRASAELEVDMADSASLQPEATCPGTRCGFHSQVRDPTLSTIWPHARNPKGTWLLP